MQQKYNRITMKRNNEDRRSGKTLPAPYLSSEGMVLFNRREKDRRETAQQPTSAETNTDNVPTPY